MNLAIHDFSLLSQLLKEGRTQAWPERKVVPWATEGQFLGRPHLRRLQNAVGLEVWKISPEERSFFLLFQERLRRRFSHREAELLFLADRSGSVLLTGEQMVAEAAVGLGLPVCSSNETELDDYFPRPREGSTRFPMASVVQDMRKNLVHSPITPPFTPQTTPSTWRVPGRDESVNAPSAPATRRSKGSASRLEIAQCNQQEIIVSHGKN